MKAQYLGRYSVADDGATFQVGTPIEGLQVKLRYLVATVRTAVSAGGSITLTVQKKDLDGTVTDIGSVTVTDGSAVGDKIKVNGSGSAEDADEIQVAVSTAGGPAAGEVDLWAEFEWTL